MYSNAPSLEEDATKTQILFNRIYSIFITITFVCAMYTTLVFALLGLYGNTSIGMGKDSGYLDFVKATSSIRVFGFKTFIASLSSFQISFLFHICLKFKGPTRKLIFAVGLAAMLVSVTHFRFILQTASAMIFNS